MENQEAVELEPATAAAELADPALEQERQVVANWQKSEAQTLYLKFAELDTTFISFVKHLYLVDMVAVALFGAFGFIETRSWMVIFFALFCLAILLGLYQLCDVVIKAVEILKAPPAAMQAPSAGSPAAAKSRVGNVRSRPERQRFGAR